MAAPLVKDAQREGADPQLKGFTGSNSHKATEPTELPICECSDEGKNKQQRYVTGFPSLDLRFTDNMISFPGRRVRGETV